MTSPSTASAGLRRERVLAGVAAVGVAVALGWGMVATAAPGREAAVGWLVAVGGVSLAAALAGWAAAAGVSAATLASGWLWVLADVEGPASIATVVGAGLYLLVELAWWAGPVRHRGGGAALSRLARLAVIVLVAGAAGAGALGLDASLRDGRLAIVLGLAAVAAIGVAFITLVRRAVGQ